MSHDWKATGEFLYKRDNFVNEGRQIFVCRNCGYETHRHSAPDASEKVHIRIDENVNQYMTCDEVVVFRVMES